MILQKVKFHIECLKNGHALKYLFQELTIIYIFFLYLHKNFKILRFFLKMQKLQFQHLLL